MNSYKYIFRDHDLVHVLSLKVSQNSKLGLAIVLQTYHFSVDQFDDFTQDQINCMGCPFSYSANTELSGKCYTHKGLQRLGLNSIIKSINLSKVKEFSTKEFNAFLAKVKRSSLSLIRFGAYGEPVTLPLHVRDSLFALVKGEIKVTGYTHAWRTVNDTRFMASTHTLVENLEANKLGYRSFLVLNNNETIDKKLSTNCPASKEAGKKLTCSTCGLCNGTTKGIKKNIHILKH